MTARHGCSHRLLASAGLAIAATGAACGRIGFDPSQPASGAIDATNGSAANGDGGAPGDATVAGCAGAIAVPVSTRVLANTCDGMDRIDGCGPAGTREVIFKFVPPASTGYVAGAYDPGTSNVSNSTGVLDSTCSTVARCAGLTSMPYTAGVAAYFVVEAASGGCASIEFEVN